MEQLKFVLEKEMSYNTAHAYIEYLPDAFLVSKVNRYDMKCLRCILSPLKYYFLYYICMKRVGNHNK